MTFPSRSLLFAGLLLLVSNTCLAQVPTGTRPFGSFGGGPVDTIDLANLNVHFAVPIFSRAGRGVPFTYNLQYDTFV